MSEMLMNENRAVQYVRMSTDMQQYSIENQREVIGAYAARRGLIIVRSYEDAGRSGLLLENRKALKTLIDDVKCGRADFRIILVYDVSRWGRFQNSDESAYYEFVCKKGGVNIEYCAEQFVNDGSLTATIIKNIKRAMAGEFSRELSVRVHAGQSRIAALGFHVGATAGFGLRRCLVDEEGNRKMELGFGQRKSIHTERVILVPGTPGEISVIHRVYNLFIDQKESLNAIARILNAQGALNVSGRAWTPISVRELLSNEKYMGNCVYNRTSKKLSANWRRNPRQEWVRKVGAFEPVVSPERFLKAQRQLQDNADHYTDNEMLDFLTAIWCRDKGLSRDLVDDSAGAPSTNTYKQHFGSLTNAFYRIGYTNPRLANHETLRNLRRGVCKEIAAHIPEFGGTVTVARGWNSQLRVNGELNVTVAIGRASLGAKARRQNQWRFSYRSKRKPDMLIVARVEQGSSSVRDYFVLPFMLLPHGSWLTVSGINYLRLERFRFASLVSFYRLCARTLLNVTSDARPTRTDP